LQLLINTFKRYSQLPIHNKHVQRANLMTNIIYYTYRTLPISLLQGIQKRIMTIFGLKVHFSQSKYARKFLSVKPLVTKL